MKETVIFRKDKTSVFALFPYIIHQGYFVVTYEHIGQHSGADYNHCINTSRPARPKEYEPLKKELESIGYNLLVREKMNYTKYLQAVEKARKDYPKEYQK